MNYFLEGQIGVRVLGSGSRGNSLFLSDGSRAGILIDAGLSGRELIRRLEKCGYKPEQIEAVVLTHEHADHVRGLKGLVKNHPVAIWSNALTAQYLHSSGFDSENWNVFETGQEFCVGSARLVPIPVPHDAYDPCGFIVSWNNVRVAVLTDLGYCTEHVREAAICSDVLLLEANYEESLLANDTKRPWVTKQRISSRHGHLSNRQASDLILGLRDSGTPLKHVFLAHMSEDCNQPDLAVEQIKSALKEARLDHVQVHLTLQEDISELVIL